MLKLPSKSNKNLQEICEQYPNIQKNKKPTSKPPIGFLLSKL